MIPPTDLLALADGNQDAIHGSLEPGVLRLARLWAQVCPEGLRQPYVAIAWGQAVMHWIFDPRDPEKVRDLVVEVDLETGKAVVTLEHIRFDGGPPAETKALITPEDWGWVVEKVREAYP